MSSRRRSSSSWPAQRRSRPASPRMRRRPAPLWITPSTSREHVCRHGDTQPIRRLRLWRGRTHACEQALAAAAAAAEASAAAAAAAEASGAAARRDRAARQARVQLGPTIAHGGDAM
eukprot:7388105-Prymnesium_polylepis.1